jgi:nicotinate-nucleotide adenylyltransferase
LKRTGILAGAFNPVTRAHVALADASRSLVDEIVCVIPRAYPHKELHGATIEERLEMLDRAGVHDRVAQTDGGLFIEIASELQTPGVELFFICGADAASRILNWDYGDPGTVDRMMQQFSLLVAPRNHHFDPPARFRDRIIELPMPSEFQEVSSTEVRTRIAAGEPWHDLVPESIIEMVERIYRK